MTRRRGRRRKKLLDDLKDRRGYCQLKEEALDRTVWRNHFGRGFGPVVCQITDDDKMKGYWTGEVCTVNGEKRNVYKIFIGKPEKEKDVTWES